MPNPARIICASIVQSGNGIFILGDELVVPLVAAVHVGGLEEVRLEALFKGELLDPADDGLQDCRANGGGRRAHHGAVRREEGRIAQHAAVVQHQIGRLEQAQIQLIAAGHLGGVLHGGQRDDVGAALAGLLGQQHGHCVTAGVGDGDQHIALLNRILLQQDGQPGFVALLVGGLGGGDVQHQLFVQDGTDPRHAACAVEDLQRQQVAVARAEGVEHAAVTEALGNFVGGFLHAGLLGLQRAGDQGGQVVKIGMNGAHFLISS